MKGVLVFTMILVFLCNVFSPVHVQNTTSSPTNGCCPSMQEQVNYLLSQVSYLTNVSELQANQLSGLESNIQDLQNQLNEVTSSPLYQEDKFSCEEFKLSGYVESGMYTLDPDGPEELEPFQVYCNFSTDPATTLIGHDSENRTLVTGCQDPGCYAHSVTYTISLEQLRAVISNSENCQQYVSYSCLASMMFGYTEYAWWLSRDGVEQHYWGGAPPDSRMCACGANGNCEGKSTTCNCDNNDEVWRQDDGYLTAKDTLPVTQLNFGDVFGLLELGYFTLGKLECQGRAKDRSCATLKQAGLQSGYYEINPDPLNILHPFTVYCDMEGYPGTGKTVVSHNRQGKSDRVYGSSTPEYFDVQYPNTTLEQIEALVTYSEHCRQYIEWQCYRTGMLSNTDTYWVDRNGTKQRYWGGADPEHSTYCGCGETGMCLPDGNSGNRCNCDYTGGSTRVDSGFLYDKSTLPVTGMNYGFYYTSSSYYGYYTLGNLECY